MSHTFSFVLYVLDRGSQCLLISRHNNICSISIYVSNDPDFETVIYSGRVLKDESLLSEYKIQSGHSIHMVKGAPRAAVPPSTTQQIPINLNAGQQIAGNPLAPLLNATNQIPAFNPFADMGISLVSLRLLFICIPTLSIPHHLGSEKMPDYSVSIKAGCILLT